jgi:hypothetical protein
MKSLFVFFSTICIQCFLCCSSPKNCPSVPPVEFRNIRVAFPQTGWDTKEKFSGRLFVHGGELTTDSLVWNSHVRWFLTGADLFEMDTSTYLKQAKVYGVTFSLFDERDLTDTDLVAELEKQLGGKFVFTSKPGRKSFYRYSDNCLSVLIHYGQDKNGLFPRVSFCYGLSEDELTYYANSPGRRWFD